MKTEAKLETQNFSWLDVPKACWYFVEKDKARFLFYFVVLTLIFAYDLVPAYVVGRIIDFFSSYTPGDSLRPFYFYVVFIGITYIIASQIRLISKNKLSIIRQHMRARARIWGFERLTEFSLEWHTKENTGSKIQRLFTGSEALAGWVKMLTKDLLRMLANIVGVAVVFFFIDFKFLLLVLIYIALFLSIEFIFGRKVFALSNEFNRLNRLASGTHVESAGNMLSVKALGAEGGMLGSVADKETLSRDIGIQKSITANLKWRIFQFFNGIVLALFLYLIGSSLISGIITIGLILVIYNYFDKLKSALSDLADLYLDLIDLRSDLGQMMPIFRETEFIKTGNESFPRDWKKIEIKNAVMDYGSGQMGLHDFNLTLSRNTKTGIAGLSGSGKSTLAKIILGLYALKSGEFKIGDKRYYDISHNETLSNLTVVLQETELFNLSMRENITMMRDEDPELLDRAIEISELGEIVNKLADGMDSLIGEKGYMLSGGERQRLGIGRAIYKNAPIMLMDEATSSLDSETEGKIMEKLLGEYGKDKTFLIIAHRLGTLKYTDNIAVMDEGRVVEEGSYDKLMSDGASAFYRMNNLPPAPLLSGEGEGVR